MCCPSPHPHTKLPGTSSGYSIVYQQGWVRVPGKPQLYSPPASVCHRERHIFLQEVHGSFLGAWTKLLIPAHPCKGALGLSFSKTPLELLRAAQGGLRVFGSFPARKGNPRPSPERSLVTMGKTGKERSPRTLPASTAQGPGPPTVTCSNKANTRVEEAMGSSGAIRAVSVARKWSGKRRSGKRHPWVHIPGVARGQGVTVPKEGELQSHQS